MSADSILGRFPVCPHGNATLVSGALVTMLYELETSIGFELHFNSGYRCASCNKAVGGVPNSGHLRGLAVDVSAPDSSTRFRIVQLSLKIGFRRIGIGKNFIHLDTDDSLPLNMMWVYS